jgi:hypothetical protein
MYIRSYLGNIFTSDLNVRCVVHEKNTYANKPRIVLYKNGIKIANRCFENVAQIKYLETTVTDQNLIQERIKRRFNSEPFVFSSAV